MIPTRPAVLALACMVAGCSSSSSGPAPTGIIAGTVSSSLGGGVSHAAVVVTPSGATALAADTTTSNGGYTVSRVPVGNGSVTVLNVPNLCTAPPAKSYANLGSGTTDTVNFTVTCARPVGTVTGTVTSSLGGAIAGVAVTVTPTGASALSAVNANASGVYTVANVPDGGGTIALSALPPNCSTPSPTAYSGVTTGGLVTVNVIAPCVPPTGSLTVTVTAPTGITPKVTVNGPGGYSHALSATTTLTKLPIGSYTVTAADTTVSDTIVNSMYSAAIGGSPATVPNGGSASATVSYGTGGSGALWVVSELPQILEGFAASGLRASGSVTPDTLQMPSFPFSLAFDASGNAWVAQIGQLAEFPPAQLASGGTGTAVTTLTNSGFTSPFAMAFDKSGNLWISDAQSNTVKEFTAAQLRTGGAQAPTVTISGSEITSALGIAFDANGTLWVANIGNVLGFSSSQLATSGSPTPITITVATARLTGQSIYGVAFDANGNMWVDAYQYVVEYTPSQLTVTGTPTPATTVTLASTGPYNPSLFGSAFDNSGNLWLVDFGNAQLIEFSAAQLTAGGTQTPQVTIPVAMGSASINSVAFDPHSATLPLNAARVVSRPKVQHR